LIVTPTRVSKLQSAGLACALALGIGCGQQGAVEFEPIGTRDLSMLELMIEMDPSYLGIQPVLRDVSKLEAIASAADLIGTLTDDPRMTGYTQRVDFERDPAPFEIFRTDLLESARAAAAGARAGDLDGLHDAYARMSASCIACHKRYSPHQ